MFVSTPESTSLVTFAESGVCLKHLSGTIGFKHGLGGLNGVLLRDINRDMYVISAKSKVAEFKSKSFKIPERLGAGIDMRLFFETVEVAFGFKHHGHPVVSCVNRWLFMATANYIYHTIFCSCRVREGQANACRTRQKSNCLSGEKGDATFHLRVLRYCFRPRGILSRS